MTVDYYELLGVGPDAASDEIRRAYRDHAQTAMWDRPRFTLLGEAFETLKDPAKRDAYDAVWRAAKGNSVAGGAAANGAADAAAAMPLPAAATGGAVAYPTESADPHSTQGMTLVPCLVCRTPNVPGERFCSECGFLLGSGASAVGAAQRPLPRLIDARGREWPLKAGDNVVGREGADVMLPDRTVSRRHARIVVETENSGAVWLEDMGSTNGTKRAGMTLPPGQRAQLSDNTQIQFGAIVLTVIVPPAASTAPVLSLPLPVASPASPSDPPVALNAPVESPSLDAQTVPPPAEPDEESPEPAAPADVPPGPRLVGKNGQVYALTETTTSFGRRTTNHFVLTGDPYVSGAHAHIVFAGGGFTLIDLGSTNGTKVNNKKLAANTPAPIRDGDEVVLGQTPLTFHEKS